jgi:hypothetical protein
VSYFRTLGEVSAPPSFFQKIVDVITKPTEAITGKTLVMPPDYLNRPSAAQIEAARIQGKQIAESARAKVPQPSVWDRISSGLNIYGKMQTPQQSAASSAPSSIPWIPIAVGGGLLAVVLVMRKK